VKYFFQCLFLAASCYLLAVADLQFGSYICVPQTSSGMNVGFYLACKKWCQCQFHSKKKDKNMAGVTLCPDKKASCFLNEAIDRL